LTTHHDVTHGCPTARAPGTIGWVGFTPESRPLQGSLVSARFQKAAEKEREGDEEREERNGRQEE